MDDVLIFSDGSRRDTNRLFSGLELFKTTTGMEVNQHISFMALSNPEEEKIEYLATRLPFQAGDLNKGFKYLCFYLKPNDYRRSYWNDC